MIKGLAHVCLSALNLEATERFYSVGLGLKKAFDFIRNDRVIGFYYELPRNAYIEVFQRGEIDTKASSPISHFCLEVEDIDKVGARLTENGFEVTKKILGADQSWQIWTVDPSGVRIEFHQYTDRSSQRTGENCILPSTIK